MCSHTERKLKKEKAAVEQKLTAAAAAAAQNRLNEAVRIHLD